METSSTILNNEAGGNNGGVFSLFGGLLNNYGTVTNKAGGKIINDDLSGTQFNN